MDKRWKLFIDRLELLPVEPSLNDIKKCVTEMDANRLPVTEYTCFSDQTYARNIVYTSRKLELIVLCFKKGQFTPIHDHDGSIGLMIGCEGIMSEELFELQPSGIPVPTYNRTFHTGELSYINLKTIHRVSNTHEENLVGINVYFPPLTSMNIYNLENNKVEKWTSKPDSQ